MSDRVFNFMMFTVLLKYLGESVKKLLRESEISLFLLLLLLMGLFATTGVTTLFRDRRRPILGASNHF